MIIVSVLVLIAGVLHFVSAPERFKKWKFLGYFYIILGLLEKILSVYFFVNFPMARELALWLLPLLLIVFGLQQFFNKPFLPHENANKYVVIRKFCELLALLLLIFVYK